MDIKAFGNILARWGDKLVKRLGGRVLAILLAAMVLALIAVFITDAWIVEIEKQSAQISQVQRNIMVLQQLRTSLNQAESAQRGYLLNHKNELVSAFDQAIDASRRYIQKVEGLLTSQTDFMQDKQEQSWLIALSSSLEARNAEMKLAISLVQTGKEEEALQVVKLDHGAAEMAKFMQYTQTLIDQQSQAQTKLMQKREKTIVITRSAVIGSTLLLLLLVIMVIRQLVQEMNHRDQLRQQLARDCETYEERMRENSYMMKTLALDYQSDVERARQKLARELHDELGSILTATKMDIAWTIRRVKDREPELVDKLDKTMGYLKRGIEFKRQVVHNLHPSIISTIGFWPALRSLVEDMAERNEWTLDLILPDETVELQETVSLIVYRVVQETLNNASKYAQATEVSVHLVDSLDHLKLEIDDNGIGTDLDKKTSTTHGLSGIRSRIMALGGSVDITSAPDQGFSLMVIIPTRLGSA